MGNIAKGVVVEGQDTQLEPMGMLWLPPALRVEASSAVGVGVAELGKPTVAGTPWEVGVASLVV